MKPTLINAFTRVEPAITGRAGRAVSASGRVSSLATMTARVESCGFGAMLELTPVQAIDAAWLLLQSRSAPRLTVVMNVAQHVWTENGKPLSIAEIMIRLGLETRAIFDEDAVLVDDDSLLQFLSLIETESLLAVAVDAPIEARDVEAIRKAVVAGLSPLDVELNASAAIFVSRDLHVVAHVRTKSLALDLIGQNLRHYLAAVTDAPASRFDAPQAWQLERLLSESGRIVVRPVETNVMSGSIDVGVNTERDNTFGPAKHSLIYDRHSATWHDET